MRPKINRLFIGTGCIALGLALLVTVKGGKDKDSKLKKDMPSVPEGRPRLAFIPRVSPPMTAARVPPIPQSQRQPRVPEAGTTSAEFRHSIETAHERQLRDPTWAANLESQLDLEFDRYGRTRLNLERIDCRSSACLIRIRHATAEDSESFRRAVLNGRLLNTPKFLNEQNRCSLHSFSDPAELRDELYLVCGG